MTDSLEELRIIAKDGGRLSSADRELLARAADEFEYVCKVLVATQAALIESQQKRIALNELVLEQRRANPAPPQYDPAKWGSQNLGRI